MNYNITVVFILFLSCNTIHKTTNSLSKADCSIPMQLEIGITIKEIDTISLDLYDLVHFYYQRRSNKGIIVKNKSSLAKYYINEKKTVKLCDFWNYRCLSGKGDTLFLGGHFALNGRVMNGKKIVLDLGDDAAVPVFEVCTPSSP